ncbi:MAG: PA0069 family radical SAM protein [Gluconacetobacter diazotrophicus]|nr:PA0069 family radical SAM protein [Gluconacetobacter diazotrophicus]
MAAGARGRGADGNRAGRFERLSTDPFDDGWEPDDAAPVRTTLAVDRSRTVISRNTSPDLGFDRAVNPYRGCEHGCIYCYARPTHAYLGLSPGLDFESRLLFKPDVAASLERELRRAGYVPDTMVLGSVTDPYQPVDRDKRLSRAVLEVLERFDHPVSVVTKGAGVLRDRDVLGRMAARGLARVWVSLPTLDPRLARSMEPRAASPARRLEVIAALAEGGVPAGVLAAPMIPGLNDHELERILQAAAANGAGMAGWTMIRLPGEVAELFEDWLEREQPLRAKRVMALIREVRGGGVNDPRFGTRMRGEGPYAALLARRFEQATKRFGLKRRGDPELRQVRAAGPDGIAPVATTDGGQGRLF